MRDIILENFHSRTSQYYWDWDLEHLDEQHRDALTANETHNNRVKNQNDKSRKHRVFSEEQLVFLWDQEKEPLGEGKFKWMWLGPYIVSKFLKKGSYELTNYDGNKLSNPTNGLYLKKYYT